MPNQPIRRFPRVEALKRQMAKQKQEHQTAENGPSYDPFLEVKPGDLPISFTDDSGFAPTKPANPNANPNDPFDDGTVNWESTVRPNNSLRAFIEGEGEHGYTEDDVLEAATDAVQASNPNVAGNDPAIHQAAQELVAGVLDDISEKEAVLFVSRNPNYVRTDDNFEVILAFIVARYAPGEIDVETTENDDVVTFLAQHKPRLFTTAHLQEAFDELYPDHLPDLPEGIGRALSVNERRTAQVISASSDTVGAIMYALGIAHPELKARVESGEVDIFGALADSRYAASLKEIVFLVWETSPNQGGGIPEGYIPSEANKQAVFDVMGDRPATFALVGACWRQVKREQNEAHAPNLVAMSERARQRQRSGGPLADEVAAMSPEEIESLSDSELEAAMRNIATERAAAFRRSKVL